MIRVQFLPFTNTAVAGQKRSVAVFPPSHPDKPHEVPEPPGTPEKKPNPSPPEKPPVPSPDERPLVDPPKTPLKPVIPERPPHPRKAAV